MLKKIGMVLMILGVCTADSEMLIIPFVLMGVGIWLVRGVVEWE